MPEVTERTRLYRRYARIAAWAAGALVVAATSFAFLDTSGVTSTTITAAGSSGVTITLPPATLSGTAGASNPTFWASSGTSAPATSGMWAPQLNTPTAVTQAGDVAIVNASSLTPASNVIVNVTITNTPALNGAYSYFNLPVNLDAWTYSGSGGSWPPAKLSDGTQLVSTAPSFLSLSNGSASWEVPGGGVYEIVIPYDSADTNGDDGSFYMFNATGTTGPTYSLSPDFYVSTQTVG
jgi:hypothetical protein